MRTRFIFTLLLCLSAIGFAQKSSIDFEIRNLGINVDGHFNTFTINATFDDSGILKEIYGQINVKSIRTGIQSRDEHLLKEDYFNIEKYPSIILKSNSISKKSDTQYKVTADLKIKGKTKQISIPVRVVKQKSDYKISTYFEINRKDFNVGGGSLVMSKTVKLTVVHFQNL